MRAKDRYTPRIIPCVTKGSNEDHLHCRYPADNGIRLPNMEREKHQDSSGNTRQLLQAEQDDTTSTREMVQIPRLDLIYEN